MFKKILPSLFSGKRDRGALKMRGQTRMIRKGAGAAEPPGKDAPTGASETVKQVLEDARAGAADAPSAAAPSAAEASERVKASAKDRQALIAEALEVRRQSAKILDDLDPKLRFRVVAAALAQTRGILEEDR